MDTSRDLVRQTLEFKNPKRAVRHLWTLPWASIYHGEELKAIQRDYPDDIVQAPLNGATAEGFTARPGEAEGEPFEVGTYLDGWGCRFINKQRGVIGEIKQPLLTDEEWLDDDKLMLPERTLQFDQEAVNRFCQNTDQFVLAGDWARPFERLQFLRGTEQLYVDLMLKPERMQKTIDRVHDFYCRLIETWCQTDVDAVWFMDDWGSQRSLLINPALWVDVFKPMYKDYIDIAHRCGKKIFMHSDGFIVDILPHLIELGLDAVNAQLFCMGVENLSQFKGAITFWGEIDRQHLLPSGTLEDIRAAVKSVKTNLWENGGCIAQCEFGPGAKPQNVREVFDAWEKMVGE